MKLTDAQQKSIKKLEEYFDNVRVDENMIKWPIGHGDIEVKYSHLDRKGNTLFNNTVKVNLDGSLEFLEKIEGDKDE